MVSSTWAFFLPLVIHLPSEKSILPKFSSLRGVAVSVSFPRKETECGLVGTSVPETNVAAIYGGSRLVAEAPEMR